jgi:hypothetical protein
MEQRRQERSSVEFTRYIKQISYLCDVLVDALDWEADWKRVWLVYASSFPSPWRYASIPAMDEVIWRGGLRTRLTRDWFHRWVGSAAYDAVPLAS